MIFQASKRHLSLLILFILCSYNFYAQEAPYGSFGLRKIYQSTLINPVLIPDSTAVENSLSFIPFVPASPFDFGGNIEVGSLKLGTITSSIQGGTLNLNTVIDGMQNAKNSDLFVGANMSLVHVYLKVGKKGRRIEISQRFKTSVGTNMINKRTFNVFLGNNDNSTSTVADLTDTKMRAMAWNEIAFGYTAKVGKKWLVGGKLKYLTGVAYADFNSTKLVASLSPDGNSFDIDSKIRTASLNPISDTAYNQDLTPYKNDMGPMMMAGLTKNIGLATDLGVGYKINRTFNAFAGVNDLGFITWKNNPLTYTNKAVLSDFYPITYNSDTKKYEFNLDKLIENGNVKATSFTTSLNAHLNAGTTIQAARWFHSTVLADAYLVNGTIAYPGATVAGTVNGGRFSEFTINAGYNKERPFRIGTGMSMKAGVLQMHLFSNNVIGLFDASQLQAVDVQFGLSWVWRNKVKKTV